MTERSAPAQPPSMKTRFRETFMATLQRIRGAAPHVLTSKRADLAPAGPLVSLAHPAVELEAPLAPALLAIPPAPPLPLLPAPIDPVAVARACDAAGFPELTSTLLRAGAGMVAVHARLEAATAIQQCALLAGVPRMARHLVMANVSLEAARSLVFAAKASADGAVQTSTAHANGPTPATAATFDVAAIYERLNASTGRRAANRSGKQATADVAARAIGGRV